MKLWHSFLKEMKLSARGFYFYVEILVAVIILVMILFVVPENFRSVEDEYLFYDWPEGVFEEFVLPTLMEDDLDGKIESVEVEGDDILYPAQLIESEGTRYYIFESEEAVLRLTDLDRPKIGAIIRMDEQSQPYYEYYLQGYETQRLRNVYSIFHILDFDLMEAEFESQEVRSLTDGYLELSDRENIVPAMLTFNGSMMGVFIIAAYIFLDKQSGIIKAYAITASSVWQYLMSKVLVVLVSTILSTVIIVVPIMRLQPNYGILFVLLLASGLFSSTLGLVVASFYRNMMQAFGILYFLMIGLMLPAIAYFTPSWNPAWVQWIPTYPLIQAFKETILVNGDIGYVAWVSLGFFIASGILFVFANARYKKTLVS